MPELWICCYSLVVRCGTRFQCQCYFGGYLVVLWLVSSQLTTEENSLSTKPVIQASEVEWCSNNVRDQLNRRQGPVSHTSCPAGVKEAHNMSCLSGDGVNQQAKIYYLALRTHFCCRVWVVTAVLLSNVEHRCNIIVMSTVIGVPILIDSHEISKRCPQHVSKFCLNQWRDNPIASVSSLFFRGGNSR